MALALFIFAIGTGLLYFTTEQLPLDYRFPKKDRELSTVNPQSLEREFLKYFPGKTFSEVEEKPKGLPSNLRLIGFLKVGNTLSVILKIGNKSLVLVSGQKVDGWEIVGVRGNKVILSYYGKQVALPIPQPEIKGSNAAIPTGVEIPNGGSITKTVSREEVNRLLQNYGQLLRGIDFVAYVRNGKTEGFRIRYLNPSSVFYKLGFRIGDVIVSVNGVKLTNTQDVFRVIQIIQNEPNVRVEIIRNGKPMTLNIRIE